MLRRDFLKGISIVGTATLAVGGDATEAEAAVSADETRVHSGQIHLSLNINGQHHQVQVEPRTTLLSALRHYLDPPLTGTKEVCNRGACGACTVLLDGLAVNACMLLAVDAVGKKITTIEGLSSQDRLHPIQSAFVAHDALMCGFCTPGFVLSVKACLDHHPHASEQQIREACAGNLCRCGTYPRVLEAALAQHRG